jgi:hypothetical protein
MSAYDELVERCATAYDNVLWGVFEGTTSAREMQLAASRAFLAEVRRTLETVTPEMVAGYWGEFDKCEPKVTARRLATNAWIDMLRASPLNPEGKK